DADLHRACRAEAVLPAVHSRQGGLAVVAFHLADPGEDHPRDPVLLAGGLEYRQVISRDRVGRHRAGRRLADRPAVPGGAGGARPFRLPAAAAAARPANHELPADASSTSLACQLAPLPVTVMAKSTVDWL